MTGKWKITVDAAPYAGKDQEVLAGPRTRTIEVRADGFRDASVQAEAFRLGVLSSGYVWMASIHGIVRVETLVP